MKKNIKIIVFSEEDVRDLPTKPVEFLEWWSSKFNLVPEEYRGTTVVNCETSDGYDGTQIDVEISYSRPETDNEKIVRLKKEYAHLKLIERQNASHVTRLMMTINKG